MGYGHSGEGHEGAVLVMKPCPTALEPMYKSTIKNFEMKSQKFEVEGSLCGGEGLV